MLRKIATLILMILLFTCLGATLRVRMQELSVAMKDLLILSQNAAEWSSPERSPSILRNLNTMKTLIHTIQEKSIHELNGDPSVTILMPSLSSEIKLTLSAFQLGQYEFSRQSTRNLTATCFACHSREPEFNSILNQTLETSPYTLGEIEKARLYVSVRNIEKAIETYEKCVLDPVLAQKNFDTWYRAFREEIILLIRTKRDPSASLKLIERTLNLKGMPYFMISEIKDWSAQIKDWTKEKGKPDSLTENGLYQKTKAIMNRALALKKYPMDHSADPLMLRASSLLYEGMRRFPGGPHLGEFYYWLGIAQITLADAPFENLHEAFFEACIRKSPHTPLSLKCYGQLEKSVYFGFTGSSGTHIPVEATNKLLELWGKAFVPEEIRP